ncbi:MAG: TraR/DksA family transcriptional regulator [Actinomycetota bacterium]
MSPARKPSAGRSGASKAKRTAKKTTPKRTVGKKTTARKSASKSKKTTAKKTTAKKSVAKKSTKAAPKKTAAKKPVAKKTPAGKTAKKTAAKKTPAKTTRGKAEAVAPVKKKTAAARPFVRPTFTLPPKRKTRPAKLDAAQLKKIKATLTTKRTQLEQRMAELEEDSFDSTQSDITGEVGLDEDFADAGTATFERERDLSIRNNIRDLIDQMTRAIDRIEQGTYGTCERCGQPIDAARLRELPHASLCLDCKRREERAR